MKKRIGCLALAAAMTLAGCAFLPQEASSAAADPPRALPSPQSHTLPQSHTMTEAPPDLPLLEVDNAEELPNKPLNWWFGTERGQDNVPVQCAEMQQLYGGFGLVAQGPDPGAVYLTFDLGYETGCTEQILDTLLDRGALATFFLTLSYPQKNPELTARMIEEGHSLGGHSITHPGAPAGLAGLPPQEMRGEMTAVADYLRAEYGYSSRLFRFPEGIYSQRALAEAALLGQYSVFWGYAYHDFDPENQPPREESLQKALNAAHPGAIYLLHPQRTNADMLGGLIDGLRAAGYRVAAL